jgi:hypothetical protein
MLTADPIAPNTDPDLDSAAPTVAEGRVPPRFAHEAPLEGRRRDRGVAPPQQDPPVRGSWLGIATGVKILAALGFVAAAALGGIVANYYEFSTRETAIVAGLLGMFGASLGAIIPPLTKAIGWILLCAGIALIGIGSLRLLGLLVPEFLERVLG